MVLVCMRLVWQAGVRLPDGKDPRADKFMGVSLAGGVSRRRADRHGNFKYDPPQKGPTGDMRAEHHALVAHMLRETQRLQPERWASLLWPCGCCCMYAGPLLLCCH